MNEQLIALLNVLSNSKLISELLEITSITTDNNYLVLNSGVNDAQKLKIPLLRGALGDYNATTNTPSLSNGTGLAGDTFTVTVAGSRDFGNGFVSLIVDDVIWYNGTKWIKLTKTQISDIIGLQDALDNINASNVIIDDTNLKVVPSTELQQFAELVDTALLNARTTGLTYGGIASVNGGLGIGNTIDVMHGGGQVLNNIDAEFPTYANLVFTDKIGLTLNATTPNITYWYVDDNTDVIKQQTTAPTRSERRIKAFLFRTVYQSSVNAITAIGSEVNPIQQEGLSIYDLASVFGQLRAKQNDLVPYAVGTNLNLGITSGGFYQYGSNYDVSYTDPHVTEIPLFNSGIADTFQYAIPTEILATNEVNIQVGNYAPLGVVTAIPGASTRIGLHFIFLFQSEKVIIGYGNEFYANVEGASNAITLIDTLSLVPNGFENALLLGAILAEKNETDLNNATFIRTNSLGRFGGGVVTTSGALLANNNLSDLENVSTALINLGLDTVQAQLDLNTTLYAESFREVGDTDGEVLQKAFDFISNASNYAEGQTLMLDGQRTYSITEPLRVSGDGWTIDGDDAVIKKTTDALPTIPLGRLITATGGYVDINENAIIIMTARVRWSSIKNLKLEGNLGEKTVTGIILNGYHNSFDRVYGRDLNVGFKVSLMFLSTWDNCEVRNCNKGWFYDADRIDVNGVPIADGQTGTSTVFTACHVVGQVGIGFDIKSLSYSSMHGCAVDGGTTAYNLIGCYGFFGQIGFERPDSSSTGIVIAYSDGSSIQLDSYDDAVNALESIYVVNSNIKISGRLRVNNTTAIKAILNSVVDAENLFYSPISGVEISTTRFDADATSYIQYKPNTGLQDLHSFNNGIDTVTNAGIQVEVNLNTTKLSTIEDFAKDDQDALEVPTTLTAQNYITDNTNVQVALSELDTAITTISGGGEINVNADWNATSGDAEILNKPDLIIGVHVGTTVFRIDDAIIFNDDAVFIAGTIAQFSGTTNGINYNDLDNLPVIPTNNNQLVNGAGYDNYGFWGLMVNGALTIISSEENVNFEAGTGIGLTYSALNNTITINNVGTPTNYLRNDQNDTTTGSLTATNFILSSDERLKNSIEPLEPKKIDANWKSFELNREKGDYRTGVIAQELEVNHPEFVKTDEEGFKSVKYIDLLIAKIAELEARLEKAGL